MMRLSTGLPEDEEEEDEREEAAGLGEMSPSSSCCGCGWCCCCCWAAGVGRYGNRRLAGSLSRVAVPGILSGVFCCVWDGTAVLPDEFRELPGRAVRALFIAGPAAPAVLRSSSYSGRGVPVFVRIERDDGARPAPELIRLGRSLVVWGFAEGSAPGTGDGALEPLAAAALSI